LVSNEALHYCLIYVCSACSTIIDIRVCKNVLYVDCLFVHVETNSMCLLDK
jgi:hypothetical protein